MWDGFVWDVDCELGVFSYVIFVDDGEVSVWVGDWGVDGDCFGIEWIGDDCVEIVCLMSFVKGVDGGDYFGEYGFCW